MVRNSDITSIWDASDRGWVAEPAPPETPSPPVNVLLVEDNAAEARLLQEILKSTLHQRFILAHVKRLAEAITHLTTNPTDVVLLDLTLPDSVGLASLDTLIRAIPSLPIVVLTNTNDEDLAVKAVRHGAQDYLVKRQVTHELLVRSLRYAIERKQTAEALREANEVLEQRVQERTVELKNANAQLRQEIEQRQRMQERLELAQKAGKIGTVEWNLQTDSFTWSSDADPEYLAPSSFTGDYHTWLQMLHPDDRARTHEELQQAIATGQGLDTEFRLVSTTDKIRWIAIKGSVFYDDTGQPQRMMGIYLDITDRKQLEAQFLRAQRLESLGTLASGIAHDLNNILTPMLAVVQLLPMKVPNLDPSTKHILETLETSAKRGANLVKQILSFARGVEGKRVTLQIKHVLSEVKGILEQTLPKSIAIHMAIDPNLWNVCGDATQLHQVVMNLCVNARDAMPQGGTLSITARNLALDEFQARNYLEGKVGDYVVVTIADTGIGIAPDILHRIFDPFFTTKEVGKGTGLGLSAVLGIVKSHNGFVDVQSQPAQGSQFSVFLPACDRDPAPLHAPLGVLVGHQELILVVDDEVAICEITKTTLEMHNYRVLTANNGEQAIALVATHHHDIHCVLIDLMMPVMDGLTTIALLRQFNPSIYAIAMSGLNSTEAVAEADRLGFQGFLAKPFTTQELLHALRQKPLCTPQ
ncbi:MAG: response regulator [Cyanobacteria bacterium]|nr:response regulator [Cyanobacteriota bacterium]MDW8200318.1 response regulator [Cyanobacteriota bacterium SKYGB_h_bin112]